MKEERPTTITIKEIPLFQSLSSSELSALKLCLREKAFQKGELLIFEGDVCERIFIVKSGRVKIFRTASSGREQILEVLGPGETCACNPGAECWYCTSSAQAVTPCQVWWLPRDNYVRLVNKNSKFINTLSKIFANRLCRFSSLIEEVSLNDTKKRLVKFILDMQEENAAPSNPQNLISIPFTREEIAQRIGTTRETVTRQINNLKELKFIDIKPHQIIIRNKEGLKKILF